MANEFRLSFTAEEIDEKLRKVDSMGTFAQSDWNQTDSSAADFIKNKPFGDMPTGGDTLYWDGNTEGLEILDLGEGGAFYKISDTTPALAEAQQGGILVTLDGTYDFTSENIMAVSDTVYAIMSPPHLIVVLENNADLFGFTVPKKGCYSMDTAGISLTINGYTGFPVTKKIEEKYLPSVGGIKYVYIDEDYDGNHTASATYAQIATWIKSGLDVKCIYFGRIVPLISSYVLSEITTYVQAACHEFTVMYDIAQGLKIQINDNDDINVYWIENIE